MTCLKNDLSATETTISTKKFLKEMGSLTSYDATALPCPPASYDDTAFEVAQKAKANETSNSN